jgi:transcriptional regulator with XRE-family HTH domain
MKLECKLVEMRFKRGRMTQQQLSDLTGIAVTTLSAYENNKSIMSIPTAYIIASALGCRVDSLYKIVK